MSGVLDSHRRRLQDDQSPPRKKRRIEGCGPKLSQPTPFPATTPNLMNARAGWDADWALLHATEPGPLSLLSMSVPTNPTPVAAPTQDKQTPSRISTARSPISCAASSRPGHIGHPPQSESTNNAYIYIGLILRLPYLSWFLYSTVLGENRNDVPMGHATPSRVSWEAPNQTGRGGDGSGGGIGGRGGDYMSHNITYNFYGPELAILEKLEVSWDAPYNSAATQQLQRRKCTPDTRVKILSEIMSWAKDGTYPLLSSLFWIFGLAGTGKSTIAQSICEALQKDGLLASSYFCSIQLNSRNSKLIVPTMAHHLATRFPSFKKHLVLALNGDPGYLYTRISDQFQDLLCAPWSLSRDESGEWQSCVVVIDALDECDNGEEVLGLILDAIDGDRLQGIRFLATSRPVPRLVEKALKLNRGPQIALHEVSKEEVSADIRLYLEEQLVKKVEPATIHQLTTQADGLFIFASTLVKHVRPHSDFMTRLEIEEKLSQILTPRDGEKVGLYALYDHILRDTFSPEKFGHEGFKQRLLVLQTVVCTEQATSADVVADLLDYDVEDVIGIINSLHSVLFTRGRGQPIYVVHASFYDFIVSRQREPFTCNLSSIHRRLTEGCLAQMQVNLKFNICNIQSSFTPNNDLPPPLDSIGEPLAYACRHWWAHIQYCTAVAEEGMRKRIGDLMEKKGLFWIEVMTLLGDEIRCEAILKGISETPSMAPPHGVKRDTMNLHQLALEAADMVAMFRTISPKMTSQLYLSLLSLWEGKNLDIWKSQFQRLPQVLFRKVDNSRNTKLIMNVGSRVQSVAFSPDGKCVVSGSNDNSVRIWDAESGYQIRKLNGHGSSVESVAFSPDGKRVVSGSLDNSVRIWDAESGQQLYQLDGHEQSVNSVAFSPNSKRVVSGSDDKSVRIWDAKSGQQLRKLNGHGSYVRSVAFCPNSKRVVSGSFDNSVRIWDAESGQQLSKLDGHGSSVQSVAFSSDSKRIVSGSFDNSVRIWDADSGKQLQRLHVHGDGVNSVAFSPDGKRVVSGSQDKSVRIWVAESGYTDPFYSVDFSPDGRHVVSTSGTFGFFDNIVRIWDTQSGKLIHKLDGHANSVNLVFFSADSQRVISGSKDNSVLIWDVKSGHCHLSLKSLIKSVSFSSATNPLSPHHEHPYNSNFDIRYFHPFYPSICALMFSYTFVSIRSPFSFSGVLSRTLPQPTSDLDTLYLCATSTSIDTHEDGWIVTSKEHTGVEHPVIWLPPSLRPYSPPTLMLMSQTGFNKIDLSGCTFGDGWFKSFGGTT
ncbi:hypothetical protein DL96DRAFT_1821733 [Flagelloscypha sp. PMI_526]|nr:hypothetical protein DL96DRAFT_1821733 [Flagelloscypha sp. PMI_526]